MSGSCNIAEEDALVEIPTNQLPQLALLYETASHEHPHIYSIIQMGIRWKAIVENNNHVSFLTSKEHWLEDGTFIAITQFSNWCSVVLATTAKENCQLLCDTLLKTNKINYNKHVQFYVTRNHNVAVMEALQKRGLEIKESAPCLMMSISQVEALKFEIEYPPDVYVQELDASVVKYIDQRWADKQEGSEEMLSTFIQLNGGYGVFLKSNNELISWIMRKHLGQIGGLLTLDDHRRKGYAILVTKLLSRKIAEQGCQPFANVDECNLNSLHMFKKIGFQIAGFVNCIVVKKTS